MVLLGEGLCQLPLPTEVHWRESARARARTRESESESESETRARARERERERGRESPLSRERDHSLLPRQRVLVVNWEGNTSREKFSVLKHVSSSTQAHTTTQIIPVPIPLSGFSASDGDIDHGSQEEEEGGVRSA